ncbi:MAG: 4Fe-4S dicluster protein [Proteobacteria bacterium]|nr:4Fe-4S dicluster protein [Pseudomonadota bacterium]
MRHKILLCDCNRTMQIDAKAIAGALDIGNLPRVQSELCRRHLAAFEAAVNSGDDLLVACTQEAPLFAELHAELKGKGAIQFVNVRETAGWSAVGRQAAPKMAALLAAADVAAPEPVPVVTYEAGFELLIIGPGAAALAWAERLAEQLSVTVLLTDDGRGAELPVARRYPVVSGRVTTLTGYLGAFAVSWQQRNPIDLEACTRCGACIEACPEQAIDFSYQIDTRKCAGHRKCVAACGTVQAIDFERAEDIRQDRFDLVLDLSAEPLMRQHGLPQGYLAPGRDPLEQALAAGRLTQLTGTFEKPKFFLYKEKICAHARSEIIGCTQCIDVCSTSAISSVPRENRVAIEPHLCMGCGGCATVCPSGAMTYAYPRVADVGLRLKAALKAYAAAGGRNPRLLFHNNTDGRELIARLGRQGKGLPADMIPIEVLHVAAIGIDLLLGSLALGAAQVVILAAGSEAPGYAEATGRQIALAEEILRGFGHDAGRLQWQAAASLQRAEQVLWKLVTPPALPAAAFNLTNDKRSTLDFVFDHLRRHAPKSVDVISLQGGAPFGEIAVNAGRCTLCMACVGACPEGALLDAKETPALRFIEQNCVQCGLCVRTCPERALELRPRLLLTPQAKAARTLNEAQAFACIKCGKPFGTKQMVDNMLGKLGKHSMFAEAGALDRIKMCADCRVIDLLQTSRHGNIHDV